MGKLYNLCWETAHLDPGKLHNKDTGKPERGYHANNVTLDVPTAKV